MKLHSRWHVSAPPDEAAIRRVAALVGVSPVTARLLVARGLSDPAAAKSFLEADITSLHDPFQLPDMDAAVVRLQRAIEAGEAVAIYGDYDVDGQTSTALLVRGLSALGLRPTWYIPERVAEGYGLNEQALQQLAAAGARLLITVDCGIQATDEVRLAGALGMDVIVTDHHEPGDTLPPAAAVINPKRRDSTYPFRELAGVGVAYKLLQALWHRMGAGELPGYALQLTALGTVADVCPLIEENRVIVRAGLTEMNTTPLPGIAALMAVSGVKRGDVTATRVGYVLGPRLNAAGRVSHAATGVELLLSDDEPAARPLAEQLEEENRVRRQLEADILDEVLHKIERDDLLADWVLVVDGDGWHPGVIGIVASRLVERFARPAIIIGLDGDVGKGSGRSISRFDLFEHLSGCADVLERFGGHQMAAGLTVARERIPELRRRLNEAAAGCLGPADLVPETRVDVELSLGDVTDNLALELERLAPFGAGNPTPVLAAPRALVVGARTVGREGEHLKLTLRCPASESVHEAIGFGGGPLLESTLPGTEVQVAFVTRLSSWKGRQRVDFHLRALQSPLARAEMEAALERPPQELPVAPIMQRRNSPVPTVDRRGRAAAHDLARVAYMASLAADGARLVAALGAGEPVDGLADAGALSLHAKADTPDTAAADWTERFVVVAGTGVDPGPLPPEAWPGRGHLVVFGLPESEQLFWSLIMRAALAPGWAIHLAFDEAAVERSRAHLERCYPGKDSLRWVYRALRALAGPDGELPAARTVAARMEQHWPGLVNEAGVVHALTIFQELRLIERGIDGSLRFARRDGGSVDVDASLRYNVGAKTKQLFGAYSRIALEATPARLLALAAERSTLDGLAFTHSGSTGLSEARG